MLEAKPQNGGLIIRPSTVVNSYALTMRLMTPRSPPQAGACTLIYLMKAVT